jgi:hypothetical protein
MSLRYINDPYCMVVPFNKPVKGIAFDNNLWGPLSRKTKNMWARYSAISIYRTNANPVIFSCFSISKEIIVSA